jgi:hypothetical protein
MGYCTRINPAGTKTVRLTINKSHAIIWVMKREILSFKIEPMKHRAHRVLFDENSPFKPKVVQSKKGEYNRKQKHRNKNDY